ncbi:hypothetical protein ABIA33_003106 [Streptacidiphilus sp. MAP12-16]
MDLGCEMAKLLRPVTADFLDRAPTRLVLAAKLHAKPDDVFRELSEDASTWPLWFREVRSAGYTGPPPYGPGAGRAVTLHGGVHFVESIVVWDQPHRFVYRVEETNLPGVHAWMEEWLLAPSAEGGTALRFTIALDVALPLQVGMRLSRPGVARAIRVAAARLDARCGIPAQRRL